MKYIAMASGYNSKMVAKLLTKKRRTYTKIQRSHATGGKSSYRQNLKNILLSTINNVSKSATAKYLLKLTIIS